jgi:hypothetical protein
MDGLDFVHDVGRGPGPIIALVRLSRSANAVRLTCSKETDNGVAILPRTFDTPMFWNESDLEELKGSSVVGSSAYYLACSRRFSTLGLFIEKIGKEDAEKDYHEKLLPAISVRFCWLFHDAVVDLSYYTSDSNGFVPGSFE